MALTLSTLGGTSLPQQFRYAVVAPRRSSHIQTQRSGVLMIEGQIVEEDKIVAWTCDDCPRSEYATLRDMFRVLDPSYLFIGAHDTTDDRYYVAFVDFPDPEPDEGGVYQLQGTFRVLRKAHADATMPVLDYADLAGRTITVTVYSGGASTETTITEGVDFTAATSNAATAASIAAAIEALTGVGATSSDNVVTVTAADATYAISSITTNAAAGDLSIEYDFDMDWWSECTRGAWTSRMAS